MTGIFRDNSLFVSSNVREAVAEGRADACPIFLSEIPHLFRRNIVQLDVALVQVSSPDNHGYCTLGTSVECTRAAIQNAKYIIGKRFWGLLTKLLIGAEQIIEWWLSPVQGFTDPAVQDSPGKIQLSEKQTDFLYLNDEQWNCT